MIANSSRVLDSRVHQIRFRPDPLAGLRGLTSKERRGKGTEKEGREAGEKVGER